MHVFLESYNSYILLHGHEHVLSSSIWEKLAPVLDLDDPNVWVECCRSKFNSSKGPWKICPLLCTVTHCVIHTCSGTYQPHLRRFRQGNYIYRQCKTPTTLNVKTKRTIIWIEHVLQSGVLFWKVRMASIVANIEKNVFHVIYPLKVQFILIGRRARGSFMFCVQEK